LCFMRIPQPIRADNSTMVTPKAIFIDVADGFKYLRKWKGLFYVTLMAAMINFLLIPSDTLMPLMVTQHFKGGVWQLSILQSAFGLGVLGGGLIMGVWGGFKRQVVTSLCGIVGLGTGIMIFGLAPANHFWFGLAGMALVGLMNPIVNGPFFGLMQMKIAPEMQGRAIGTVMSICSAMMPLSMLVVTPIVELFGLRVWYWLGGGLTILVGLMAFFIPSIMELDYVEKEISLATVTTD
jgi:MFS transporter, DHA3 family, macrolide efflux protein